MKIGWEHFSEKLKQLGLFLHKRRIGIVIGMELTAIAILLFGWYADQKGLMVSSIGKDNELSSDTEEKKNTFIKWVDFKVTSEAMTQAFRYDVETCQQDIHLNWIDLLAFLGARYGGDFSHYSSTDMDKLADSLKNGSSIEELTKDMKYYNYYKDSYTAVLGGMVGLYEIEIPASEAPSFALSDAQINEGNPGAEEEKQAPEAGQESTQESSEESRLNVSQSLGIPKVWVTKYGLKAFHPLAKNFPYSHYDDFGVSRSYGFRRQHLGHDMMGQTGTPVVAVESGYVEAIGWNQYGGWRLGIRSFDKKRYYYYAHLRKDYPYQGNLQEGSVVSAGDIIGYMGRTGYSAKENTNNIDEPHLHFGIQLIFDESQKDGNNEIWIDCYEIVKFLSVNRSESVKVNGTKEWTRIYQIKDPLVGSVTQ